MKQKITILGGTDGFGKWLAEFILKHFGSDIELTLTGRNQKKGEDLSLTLSSKKRGSEVFFSRENISAVKNADITIFSVPIAYMEQTIQLVAPHLKEHSMVLDVCSIKQFPSKVLKQYSPKSVLIVPTHPMFGPFVSSIAGQIFVLTPEESVLDDERYIYLKKQLSDFGAKILETNPEEHDKMMAVVQGLTHYDFFVFGETIKRLGVDIETSLNFVSPIYKLMISSVARYMHQNPKLYGDIQMYNEENKQVHKTFIEVSQEFSHFVKYQDEENFIKTIEGTQKYFGENAKKGQTYTDKVIFLLSKQVELINESIGKNLKFENIYSGEILTSVVREYKQEVIFLESGEGLVLDERRVF